MRTRPDTTVLLTNFIPPYRLPLYERLQNALGNFRILLSTEMEPNRAWPIEWSRLQVTLQRSASFRNTWKHPQGFSESLTLHIPLDTITLLRTLRPQLIISAELGARTLQSAIYCLLNPTTRLIIWAPLSEHTERKRGLIRSCLRRWLLRQADAVVVNGESGLRYIHAFGVPKHRIFCAPYTTEMSPFFAVPLRRETRNKYRLLFAGQLIERKGLSSYFPVLAKWANDHPQERLSISIVGDGPLRASLQSFEFPVNVSANWLGNVPYSEMARVYAGADIFVFPTLADEWGLVVNEAMAAGLPVLGSVYSQAVEELITDGVNGWIFAPDCFEGAYQTLNRALMTQRPVLEQMRNSTRERVQNLTPVSVCNRIMDAIQFVCEED